MRLVAALVLCVAASAMQLPQACKEGENQTSIPDCTPLGNDTAVAALTVAEGSYKRFHWAVSNYLDIDDSTGNRRFITFEVVPCTGSVELYVRALQQPFPTISSHDFAANAAGEPNAVTIQMYRAQYYVTAFGGSIGDSSFSIIAKLSGKRHYPAPGAGGALTVKNKFTESLLLEGDTMEMLVSFVPVLGAANYEYRVYSAPNTTGSRCSDDGAFPPGACIKTTACGVEASMTPRTPWTALTFDGTNATLTATGLPQDIEQVFVVVGRPQGANITTYPELSVVYTATSGTPTYEKVAQLQDDNTILMTLGIAGGVLLFLFIVAFAARSALLRAFQTRARRRKDDNLDTALIRREMEERQRRREGGQSRASTDKETPSAPASGAGRDANGGGRSGDGGDDDDDAAAAAAAAADHDPVSSS